MSCVKIAPDGFEFPEGTLDDSPGSSAAEPWDCVPSYPAFRRAARNSLRLCQTGECNPHYFSSGLKPVSMCDSDRNMW